MRIGKLEIPTGAVFAPMAGFTDAACRHLMARHGAAYTVSEMASAKAITYGDQKSVSLLRDKDPCGIYAVQLFGSEPDTLAQAIRIIRDKGLAFDIIDINMGCPAPKITGGGAGSRLMLDPALCGRMVRAAVDAAGDTPVTVKMRAGWDADHITAVEVARQCQENGAALVTVHGRTREQMYIPPIDPGVIRAVKQAVSIPVVGNGDINSAQDALAMIQQTGCDAVMVGRGALGNPWLFEEIRAALCGQPAPQPPTLQKRMATLRAQIYEMCERKGEWTAMPQARSQAIHYMRGLRGAAALRRACSTLSHFEDVDRLIEAVYRAQD